MDGLADGGIVEYDPERPLLIDSGTCDYIIPWSVARRLGIEPGPKES